MLLGWSYGDRTVAVPFSYSYIKPIARSLTSLPTSGIQIGSLNKLQEKYNRNSNFALIHFLQMLVWLARRLLKLFCDFCILASEIDGL